MKFTRLRINGVVLLEPKVHEDNRGWFFESFSKIEMVDNEININFIQDNHSFTKEKNTIRGIHLQKSPYGQAKLVRCTKGEILDFAIDLRKESSTYKDWISVKLTSDNKKQLYIPAGFGHAFITLTDDTEVQYKVDSPYKPDMEITIKWDDPSLNINWGTNNPILSVKDRNAVYLDNLELEF